MAKACALCLIATNILKVKADEKERGFRDHLWPLLEWKCCLSLVPSTKWIKRPPTSKLCREIVWINGRHHVDPSEAHMHVPVLVAAGGAWCPLPRGPPPRKHRLEPLPRWYPLLWFECPPLGWFYCWFCSRPDDFWKFLYELQPLPCFCWPWSGWVLKRKIIFSQFGCLCHLWWNYIIKQGCRQNDVRTKHLTKTSERAIG